jgi:transcriptional regulator with XRE-family HTH domain
MPIVYHAHMTNDKMDVIRQNIDRSIKEAKVSRLQVTKLAGISYPHLSRFLNNSKGGELGVGILYRLSEVLGVPVSYFLGDTDINGVLIGTAGGEKLPEEWDKIFKDIMKLPKIQQAKVLSIVATTVEVLK